MKRCSRCHVDLPCEMFSKHRGAKDGLQAYCRPCVRASGRPTPERAGDGPVSFSRNPFPDRNVTAYSIRMGDVEKRWEYYPFDYE